jgi:hypothetical protein
MAFSTQNVSKYLASTKPRAAMETFNLSSFGESLVPADILKWIDGGVMLGTEKNFSPGTLVRIDFYPSTGGEREIVTAGYVQDVKHQNGKKRLRIAVRFENFPKQKETGGAG